MTRRFFMALFNYRDMQKNLVQYSLHLAGNSVRILVSAFADIITFAAFSAKVFSHGQKI